MAILSALSTPKKDKNISVRSVTNLCCIAKRVMAHEPTKTISNIKLILTAKVTHHMSLNPRSICSPKKLYMEF